MISELERFVTNLDQVPVVSGLKRGDGWIDMKVHFLVDQAGAGSEKFRLGWIVLPPVPCTIDTNTSTPKNSGL
jgi:hypothetical protein